MQQLQPQAVNLQDILDARERRAQIQAELREVYNAPVISITVNMPGNVKYSQDTVNLVYTAVEKVRGYIKNEKLRLLEERVCHCAAGPAALMAVQGDARRLKAFGIAVEEEEKYGRLLDIDVFDCDGQQISRAVLGGLPARKCLVCSEAAIDCMRTNRHSEQEVREAVNKKIIHHQAAMTGILPGQLEIIGSTAVEAMLLEAVCSPAPGLVDRFNSGAHRDMDIFTFITSSSALAPAMYRCALAAWTHTGSNGDLLPVLRHIGVKAEKAMFEATNGVNTQKGLLFLMGVTVAAAALAIKNAVKLPLAEVILQNAADMCKDIVRRELDVLKEEALLRRLTAGEELYLSHGITGIRGEIERGFPSVVNKGLPGLREALAKGLSLNDALVHALILLMTETEDTTIVKRHNLCVLKSVQLDACRIIEKGGMYTAAGRESIEELDKTYSEHGISPGGSADLLAITYFLYAIENRLQK